jgi:hypothetical protein
LSVCRTGSSGAISASIVMAKTPAIAARIGFFIDSSKRRIVHFFSGGDQFMSVAEQRH